MTHRLLLIAVFVAVAPFARSQALDTDPSTIAGQGQQYRFRADFNYDGVSDVAISADRNEFGNMGGAFAIYLGTRTGKWRYVGSITAHPLAVHLEKHRDGGGILTVYLRSSGKTGRLIRYAISEHGIKQLSSKEIHPGDGGTDEGRAEYAKYFDDSIRLQPELGATIDGKVIWSRYD